MGWLSRIVDGVKYTNDVVGEGIKWTWSWTGTPLIATTIYAAKTIGYGIDQLYALKSSLPAFASPESIKILKAANHISYQVLQLMALNWANNYLQSFAPNDREEETTVLNNMIVSSSFTLVNWAVSSYTYRQAAEVLVETLVIDSLAPAIFGKHKADSPLALQSPCEEQKCNFKRRAKGSLREFFILFANDALTGAISYIPYVGKPTSIILAVYFSGDVIVRSALLDRCERHRTTDSELLLSLGLSYTAGSLLMDQFLEATVGMPPFLVHRTMRHLLLLWHVNNASHMNIKYVAPGKGTLAIDPITAYESVSSFVTDIIFAGSMDKLTKIFQPEPNKEPIISLSTLLKKLTEALRSDLEKEHPPQPGFFKKATNKILPPIFRSTKDAVHDPVIRIFWPNFQELLLDIIDIVKEAGGIVGKISTTPVPLLASAVKKALPEVLFQRYGISKQLTKFLITLCKDEDFWTFVLALKQWLERHHLRDESELAEVSSDKLTTLHEGGIKALEPPKDNEIAHHSPALLRTKKSSIEVDPNKVTPSSTKVTIDPSFFARRKKEKQQVVPVNYQEYSEQLLN